MDLPGALKEHISTLKIPSVIKHCRLPWPIFDSDVQSWCQVYDQHRTEPNSFDAGHIKHGDLPFWERFRTIEQLRFSEFLDVNTNLNGKWVSYSYKNFQDLPDAMKDNINFKPLGFENVTDILYWIGSKGSNTPCHYDTYGFNVVVQVFGSKRWLLFPPGTPLDITRIPYEESSVYCKQNFYSPKDMTQFSDVSSKCYEVIIQPGDILIVPPKWWHYVESLDNTLAINTWIPLDEDDDRARLEECLVRNHIMKMIETFDDDDELRAYILNPNENKLDDTDYAKLAKMLGVIVLDARLARHKHSAKVTSIPKSKLDTAEILEQYLVKSVPAELMSSENFNKLMHSNGERYDIDFVDRTETDDCKDVENLINAICHPDVIRAACDIYLKALVKDKERITFDHSVSHNV